MDARQLREATRAEHEATEAVMPLMGPDLTRARYVEVLETLYPLVRGWETWVENAAHPRLRGMLERRRRSHLLLDDLTALGAKPNAERRSAVDWYAVVAGSEERLAEGRFETALLGAVYVMEGSTLGGRFLARHLEAVLALGPGVGNAYFRGHGEATGAMWREVLAEIEAVREDLAPVVIGAARRTFEAFGEVLRTGLSVAGTAHG